jgi:hypothetical protein
MKNFILFVVILFTCSCSSDNELILENYTLEKSELESIETLLESTLSTQFEKSIIILESNLKKIDEVYYLVSSSGDYRTTTLLEKNEKNRILQSAGVSCTSSICSSSSSECVPKSDGKSCTKCGIQPSNCTKTVTRIQHQ